MVDSAKLGGGGGGVGGGGGGQGAIFLEDWQPF